MAETQERNDLERPITHHPKRRSTGASPAHNPPAIEIRQLERETEYRECVGLQRETWGADYTETVPATILRITQRIGGVAAGAFEPGGRLLGFIFGMTGIQNGRPVHWSDLLAVKKEARGQGIGRRLKEYQRDFVRSLGVETICWTFDPLVASNAHLNLNRLGARVTEYAPNMYGEGQSPMHEGIGTDRLIVAWPTRGTPEPEHLDLESVQHAPVATGRGYLPDAATFRIEVPADIFQVRQGSPREAARWREMTRHAFLAADEAGYRVEDFYRDPESERCYYVLTRPSSHRTG